LATFAFFRSSFRLSPGGVLVHRFSANFTQFRFYLRHRRENAVFLRDFPGLLVTGATSKCVGQGIHLFHYGGALVEKFLFWGFDTNRVCRHDGS